MRRKINDGINGGNTFSSLNFNDDDLHTDLECFTEISDGNSTWHYSLKARKYKHHKIDIFIYGWGVK